MKLYCLAVKKTLFPVLLLLFSLSQTLWGQEGIATNEPKSANSPTVKALAGLYFEKEPNDITVCEGEPVIFEVGIHYTAQHLPRIQWQTSLDGKSWADAAGQRNLRFFFTEKSKRSYTNTWVRAILSSHDIQIYSKAAQLFVENSIHIATQPKRQVVTEGGNAFFEVKLDGDIRTSNFEFQWQSSAYGTGVWENITGEYRNFLTLPAVRKEWNGYLYRVLIRSLAGCDSTVSNAEQLIVMSRPIVRVTPGAKTFCEGGNVTFSIKLEGGSGKESFQWQMKKDDQIEFQNIPGAKEIFYILPQVTPTMTGYEYRAEIKLPGNVTMYTFPAVITVDGAIAFSGQPQNKVVCLGEEAVFSTHAEFKGKEPMYQWQVSRDNGKSFENIPNATNTQLKLAVNDSKGHGNLYRALITAGSCQPIPSEAGRLSVLDDLIFTTQPQSVVLKTGQTSAVLAAEFEENGGHYLINWQRSDDEGNSWANINQAYEKKVVVRGLDPQKSALFRMRVLNRECGRLYFSNTVSVNFEQQ